MSSRPRSVRLRRVEDADLPVFYVQQLDDEANRMAAFTSKDPSDKGAFDAHWARIRTNPAISIRTILLGEDVAGYLARFPMDGELEMTYWLGREFWGAGVATRALSIFLGRFPKRPLRARVACDNVASARVLEKCGFRILGRERGFANARGEEVEEFVLRLDRA